MTDPSGRWDASWEGARRQTRASVLEATPEQRLAWLEEVLELAHQSGALARLLAQRHP